MPIDAYKPARMFVTNLVTEETVEVQYNPTELEHLLEVNWQRFTIPGLSHQPKHYVNTGNPTFPFELFYRAITPAELAQMEDLRNFFQSLAYPVEADTIEGGGPPEVLLFWPRALSLRVTLNSLSERFMHFSRQGDIVVARVRIEVEEIRSHRLLSSDVRRNGIRRPAAQAMAASLNIPGRNNATT